MLSALAAGTFVVLVVAQMVRPPRVATRGAALELFAFVAATEVLSTLSRWHGLSVVLWAVGLAAWLAIVPLVLARPSPESEPVRGSWLLAVVATNSLAVAGASITSRDHAGALLALDMAWWLIALALYCWLAWLMLGRIRRRELTIDDLHGDHWVALGALAISALAGCRVFATMATLGWSHRVHDVVQTLAIVTWVGALCWLPALVAAESWRLRQRPLYTPARWSTVFPLGMLAVASHAVALAAGLAAARPISQAFTVIAALAWVATAAGFAVSAAH